MRTSLFISMFWLACLHSSGVVAQDTHTQDLQKSTVSKPPPFYVPSAFRLSDTKPRNAVLPPFLSFLLPGFDQYWEGQYGYGGAYTLVAFGGYAALDHFSKDLSEDSLDEGGLDSRDNDFRSALLGGVVAQAAHAMSGYHAFRTAAISQQLQGTGYQFLKKHDSIGDIYAAPFRFHFLKRATTYIPLGVAVGLNIWAYNAIKKDAEGKTGDLSAADYFFTAAFSYNAGTHEEAVFRGWLLPLLHEAGLNRHIANIVQAGLFAALHLSEDNRLPLVQFAGGLLDGYITMNDGWSIQEAVFGHVWWDVLAFATVYAASEKMLSHSRKFKKRPSVKMPEEIWLPIYNAVF